MNESDPVKYRKYRDSDIETARSLWAQLTAAHRTIYDDPGIGGDDPGSFFDTHLQKVGADNIWVADMNGQVVGLMGLEVEGDELTIEPLIVDSEWRGRGIGEGFMNLAVREARARNASYLNVSPVARNTAAIRFFHINGMMNVGHVELFMDMKAKRWKDGLRLHGLDFNY
ncbi:MAG TPA: GNAT family N-acetyltransferase [Thermoplasmata archaeon]|nr:GNAT family N-acetyltransferase [Thermoplasmata archaeon]